MLLSLCLLPCCGQNVAAEVANKLCESVSLKLEGSVMGTFQSLTRTVKVSYRHSCGSGFSQVRKFSDLDAEYLFRCGRTRSFLSDRRKKCRVHYRLFLIYTFKSVRVSKRTAVYVMSCFYLSFGGTVAYFSM